MYKLSEKPQKGDIVLAKINRIMQSGAFVELIEYEENGKALDAFLPIYEVAPGRIRNIRNYVREGEIKVVVVFDTRGNKIDVSLRRVNEEQRKLKLEEYKREQKAYRILQDLAEELNLDLEEIWDKLGSKILEKYGSLYEYFVKILKEGEKSIKFRLPKRIKDKLYELIVQRIKLPSVELKGIIKSTCLKGDGIDRIKKILSIFDEKENVRVIYLGAPKYEVSIKSTDFKEARKELNKLLKDAEKLAKKENLKLVYEDLDK